MEAKKAPTKEVESHGEVTFYASTPQEYKNAVNSAEVLGLSLAEVEAVNSSCFKVHEKEAFDAWNAKASHKSYTVEPGRKWFTVQPEDRDGFKVRDPGYHDRTPKFRLKFHS